MRGIYTSMKRSKLYENSRGGIEEDNDGKEREKVLI
jgi:hypothetical protein